MDFKILVIQKESDFVKKFVHLLGEQGWAVEHCVSGISGVGRAQTFFPHLILIGDDIEDGSPSTVVKNILGAPFREIPTLIMVGSEAFYEQHQNERDLWVNKIRFFVKKPITMEETQQMFQLCQSLLKNEDMAFESVYEKILYSFSKGKVVQLDVDMADKFVEIKTENSSEESEIKESENVEQNIQPTVMSFDEIKTLKNYISIRDKEIHELQNKLAFATEQLGLVQKKMMTIDEEYKDVIGQFQEVQQRMEIVQREKEELRHRREKELASVEEENRAKSDTLIMLEKKLEMAEKHNEELKERVRRDIQRIRVREKELETKLDILKRDSETLLSAKDRKLLEFKRKIDALEYEMETLVEKERVAQNKVHEWKVRMDRILRVLKMGTSLLEGEEEPEEKIDEVSVKKAQKVA